MTKTDATPVTVVVCESQADLAGAGSFSDTLGGPPARSVRPRDLDDLERELEPGRPFRVLFLRIEDLLEALWDGNIRPEQWLEGSVHLAAREGEEWAASIRLQRLLAAWGRWTSRHRRTRIASGLILSLLAIAAAFTVLLVT